MPRPSPDRVFAPHAVSSCDLQGLADFEVRHCAPARLGEALQKLPAKQQAALVADLPWPMAASLRKALAAARG